MCAFTVTPLRLAKPPNTRSKFVKEAVRQHLAAREKQDGPSIPTIPRCPSPACDFADMPPDLDIDMDKKLNGTTATYSQQILISTGQSDWKSRIEAEENTAPWGSVVAKIKRMLAPKGRYHDVWIKHSTCLRPEADKI